MGNSDADRGPYKTWVKENTVSSVFQVDFFLISSQNDRS